MLEHLSKIDYQHKQKVSMYKKLAQEQVSNLKQLNSQVEGPTVSTKELDEAKAIIKDRD
jgi:hypothetical protein